MASTLMRSPRVRALEKLQKILYRGFREKANGYEQFFWCDNVAVLRNEYDLGAAKPGGLLLALSPGHKILNISPDDAGPAWDCSDESSEHWVEINAWATTLTNSMKTKIVLPMLAEKFVGSIWTWAGNQTTSNLLLERMAMAQWRSRAAIAPIIELVFDSHATGRKWHNRAQYLSEALNADKESTADAFEHNGKKMDSQYLFAWMLALTFKVVEDYEQNPRAKESKIHSSVYSHARLLRTVVDSNAIHYDWKITADPQNPGELLLGTVNARIVIETERGPFTCIRKGLPMGLGPLSAQTRIECIKRMHDIATGDNAALTQDAAYELDCARLAKMGNTDYIPKSGKAFLNAALRIVEQEWWGRGNTNGAALVSAIRSVYPWQDMVKDNPRNALTVLCQMAEMALPRRQADIVADGNLFEAGL